MLLAEPDVQGLSAKGETDTTFARRLSGKSIGIYASMFSDGTGKVASSTDGTVCGLTGERSWNSDPT
jgi:hypothetical protein